MSDVGVSQDGLVATVEMRRPPHNFFDSELIAELGESWFHLSQRITETWASFEFEQG